MTHSARDVLDASFLVTEEEFVPGATLPVNDAVLRHLRARRLGVGSRITLLDGQGHRATATIVRLQPHAAAHIETVDVTPAPPPVHLLVPMADRDRMLWLAEKAGELALSSWRPVLFDRSRSVKPRGEGPTFAGKVRARMASALEQSGGVWLPAIFPEARLERAIDALPPGGSRLMLRRGSVPFPSARCKVPVTLVVGPEGGFEPREVQLLEAAGFSGVHIGGDTVLRFETVGVAALALARTAITEDLRVV
ncbi:MAG: RsmE family RNA methyltransferase [Gemmatimonadota bacterium]